MPHLTILDRNFRLLTNLYEALILSKLRFLTRGLTNVVFHIFANVPLCSEMLTILVRADLICGSTSLMMCASMVFSSHCFVFIFIMILATSSSDTALNSVSLASTGPFLIGWYFSLSSSSLQIFWIFSRKNSANSLANASSFVWSGNGFSLVVPMMLFIRS